MTAPAQTKKNRPRPTIGKGSQEPISLYTYAEQELEYLDEQGGRRLLTELELMEMWGLSGDPKKGKRIIKKCRLGLDGRKSKLYAVSVGTRTYRYRLRDILTYEYFNRS